jgi:hypothetical protein
LRLNVVLAPARRGHGTLTPAAVPALTGTYLGNQHSTRTLKAVKHL